MNGRRGRGGLVAVIASNGLSVLGNGVAGIAIPWIVLQETGEPAAAGAIAAVTAAALVASALFGGALVDRLGPVRAGAASDAVSAAAVAAIPVVDALAGLSLPALAGLAVAGALLDPLAVTARDALLPSAAAAAGVRLERTNAVHEAITGTGLLVGPAAGGALIAVAGAPAALWLTAAAMALAAAAMALAPRRAAAPAHEPFARAVRRGLAFVWREPALRAVGLLSAGLTLVIAPLESVILPVHFEAIGEPGSLGLVLAAVAAGTVAGALAYGAWGHLAGRRALLLASLIVTGAGVVALGTLPPAGAMAVIGLAVGMAAGPISPLVNLAFQTRTPEAMRGRALGALAGLSYAAAPLGLAAAGMAVEALGPRPAAIAAGAAFLAVGLGACALDGLRRLDPRQPSASAG